MAKLTDHFSLEEMIFSESAIRHGLDNTPTGAARRNLKSLCRNVLEPVRTLAGGPINVTSGYRAPAVNRVIGGSLNSQHMFGEAADINCPLFNPKTLFQRIRESSIPFDQLIEEFGSWVHISHVTDRRNKRQVLRARMVNGVPTYEEL